MIFQQSFQGFLKKNRTYQIENNTFFGLEKTMLDGILCYKRTLLKKECQPVSRFLLHNRRCCFVPSVSVVCPIESPLEEKRVTQSPPHLPLLTHSIFAVNTYIAALQDMKCYIKSKFFNLTQCLRYSKLILSLKNAPKPLLFPTSKSTVRFEIVHPTSELEMIHIKKIC